MIISSLKRRWLVLIASVCFFNCTAQSQYVHEPLTWGVSMDSLIKKQRKTPTKKIGSLMVLYEKKVENDVNEAYTYSFSDNRFFSKQYSLSAPKTNSIYTLAYSDCFALFTKMYGKPVISDTIWRENDGMTRLSPNLWAMEISLGRLKLRSCWITSDSKITLSLRREEADEEIGLPSLNTFSLEMIDISFLKKKGLPVICQFN